MKIEKVVEAMTIQDKKNENLSYFEFGRWAFPKFDTLIYQADGPDKMHPDRLFIEDRRRRFLLYFEEECSRERPFGFHWEDYERFDLLDHGKRLILWYPLQEKRPNVTLGYFRIEFTDVTQKGVFCDGTLSITAPVHYMKGVESFSELYDLFRAMRMI